MIVIVLTIAATDGRVRRRLSLQLKMNHVFDIFVETENGKLQTGYNVDKGNVRDAGQYRLLVD